MKNTFKKSVLLSSIICAPLMLNVSVAEEQASEQQAAELDKVTVTATGKSASSMAQAVNVLSEDELKKHQAHSIGETLSQQLGIHNSSYGQAVGRPVIRGMDGARVKVMQDGVDTLDLSSISPDHAVNVHTHGAKQIEVLRGPATLLYGSGAFGGVVNVVDERIPHDGTHDGLENEVGIEYNSVNQGKTLTLKNEGNVDQWHWHVDASALETEEYELPDLKHSEEHHEGETEEEHEEHADEEASDKLANSDIKYNKQITFGNSYDFGEGHVGFAVSRQIADFGLPGHAHEEHEEEEAEGEEEHEEHEEGAARIGMQQTRVDFETLWNAPFAGAKSFNLKAANNDYRHTEYHQSDEGKETGSVFDRESWEARTELVLDPISSITHVMGLQAAQSDIQIKGEESILPKTESQNWGAFWLAETQIDAWTFELGGRYDSVKHSPESINTLAAECTYAASDVEDKSFSNGNISLGVIRELSTDWQVSSSIMSAKRAPDAQELFSCGAHPSTRTFEVGNPDLNSETAFNVDLGIRKVAGDFTMAFNVYQNKVADYIYSQNRGAEADELPIYDFVQADATLQGAEFESSYQFIDHWSVSMMADTVRAELDSVKAGEEKYLPRIPADRVGLGMSFDSQDWLGFVNWSQTQKQTRTGTNETETNGYDLVTAGVSYLVHTHYAEYRIDLKGTNLLDEEIRYHTSYVKDLAPQPGRGVNLALTASF